LFKAKQFEKAIQRYTMAAHIAVQRPPWESNQAMREELSTILSNRSAAFLEAGDLISALVDAETVIQFKRPWSKGHFRKAKALIALKEYQEAKDAINLGLQFDPKNAVCFVSPYTVAGIKLTTMTHRK
jgi:translocation protein SEC72